MMKKLLLLFMVAFTFIGLNAQTLIISEVVDGPGAGGYPKYVEITNIGGADAVLTGYIVKKSSNGGAFGAIHTFDAFTLPAGKSFVVTNMDNTTDGQIWSDFSLSLPEFYVTNTNANGNGDDAYALFNASDAMVDIYGALVDGTGEAWEYLDSYAKRKLTVTAPNTTFTESEWEIAAPNSLDGITDLSSYLSPGTYGESGSESSANDILTFEVPNQQGASVINTTDHTVSFDMITGTDVTALVPAITVSANATITPLTGVAQDFTSPVVYTVKAEDDTEQEWTVTCNLVEPTIELFSDDFEDGTLDKWTAFSVKGDQVWGVVDNFGYEGSKCAKMSGYDGGVIENEDWIITPALDLVVNENAVLTFLSACNYSGPELEVKYSTNYTGTGDPTVATWIDFTGFTLSAGSWEWTESGVVDLSEIKNASVYIAFVHKNQTDGSKTWEIDNVVVEVPSASTETDILTFVLDEQSGDATISAENHTVDIEVVYGTDVTALTPTITLSNGATVVPASGVEQNFTNAVTYTVTAQDGTTKQDWTVTVSVSEELSSEAEILTFSFEEETEAAVIDSEAGTIASTVAWDADVASLTPTFTISTGAQVSETVDVDFTNPVTIKVQAQDKVTIKDWVVTVTKAAEPSHEAEIKTFVLEELAADAVINSTAGTITGELVAGTDVTELLPTITVSEGAQVTPTIAQDFTSDVVYTVTAEDGTTEKDWTVTLTVKDPEKVSIYDIQYTTDESGDSPLFGQVVITAGVITGIDNYGFYLQDSAKAWNGIYINVFDLDPKFTVGDSVKVQGLVNEYWGLTQLTKVDTIISVNSDNAIPTPIDVAVTEVVEQYESVIVKTTDLVCTDTELYWDAWRAANGTDSIYIGTELYAFSPKLGQTFPSITGIVTFKRDYFRILPRETADIILGLNDNMLQVVEMYPNPVNEQLIVENAEGISEIVISNIIGQVVSTTQVNSSKVQVETSNLETGIYIVTLVSTNGELRSERIIKQ